MSLLRRQMLRKKLDDLLSKADDRAFLTMCWAVRALQTRRIATAARYLQFPREAAVTSLDEPYAIYPWFIETLVNELLIVEKALPRDHKPNRILNCGVFAAMAQVRNILGKLENAEDGLTLRRINILQEMHRLGQRQFEWQRGFLSAPQLYRAGFLYGGQQASAHFQRSTGFSISEFSHASFAIRAAFEAKPTITLDTDFTGAGLSRELSRAVLQHISLDHEAARARATSLRAQPGHVGYKRSILRTHPCIMFEKTVIAPLAELVNLRGTSGIFYDVVGAPQGVRNEVAARFERYCLDLLQAVFPEIQINSSFEYRYRGNRVHSPDVLIFRRGRLAIIMECKATRMSYDARFGEDPLTGDARGYEEMARGVFQIWRLVSHRRRGIVVEMDIADDARGFIVTLDSWLSMAAGMVDEVLARARQIAAERDPEVIAVDQIPVRFCLIDDLENTLADSTSESFFDTVLASTDGEHRTWMLENVHDKFFPGTDRSKRRYPLEHRLAEAQGTWWQVLEEEAALRGIVRET